MKENKLVLGTAQLGLDYGIANKEGKPSQKEIFKILKYAAESDVTYIDTAYNYGDSEITIGKFLISHNSYKNKFNIITKMPSLKRKIVNKELIKKYFLGSLQRLGQESIYCYMIHDFNDIKNNRDEIAHSFTKLKKEGYIKKVGVSVYDEFQIDYLLKNFEFDVIQLPINIFDQRLLENGSLIKLKKKHIEIYARSVFLQGLIFLTYNTLTLSLKKVNNYIEKLNAISLKYNLTKEEIALLFIDSINEIDKIVIGVEKIDQLQKDVKILTKSESFNKIKTLINFKDFFIKDLNVIDPRRWRR